MTTKYQCDACGRLMDFDDEKSCVMNMGLHQGDSFESNKSLDLCPTCAAELVSKLKNGSLTLDASRNFEAKGKVRRHE